MDAIIDGPATDRFSPLPVSGNCTLSQLKAKGVSPAMVNALKHAPQGSCVSWGLPFDIGKTIIFIRDRAVDVSTNPVSAPWIVFLHTSDTPASEKNEDGFITPMRGMGKLGEAAATYTVQYADGTEATQIIRRRQEVGLFQRIWGENCTHAVAHHKPRPVTSHHEQMHPSWGFSQTRADGGDPAIRSGWLNWLYAWESPHPRKKVIGFRSEPISGALVLSGISAGKASANPLRWEPREKAVLKLRKGDRFRPRLDEEGLCEQIQIDMGQVISAQPRPVYPNETWHRTYNNRLPELSNQEVLVEYAAHKDAKFKKAGTIQHVSRASQRVNVRVVLKGTGEKTAAKLHIHGESGEYLSPVDRHRIPNPAWFEDYAPEFIHLGIHRCTYIDGETTVNLPLGKVFLEVSKGFEVKPVRKAVTVRPSTKEVTIELERALPWRENGWVTADTHVHFLSPGTALLEGASEGVNVVNLLASQWGECMTNVGDFDGKTTYGTKESGGDGEYLVRVGTENRQHVMGHISLLGYEGSIIAPMTTGGPDESALGDPVEALLTEWAIQCKKQNGLVVLPHFPNPRLENAAAIVSGNVDGVEMTSWEDHYSGISAYSLSDWYRYLNCGYQVAAVGGTDKMSATTAVGTVRTYALIEPDTPFTHQAWMEAVRRGNTFVTYGPLVEFSVEGMVPGSRFSMASGGGTVDIEWRASSVTFPMSRVELIVNGEIRESKRVRRRNASGSFSCSIDRSSWLALLIRGHYVDKPEVIAAHTSPVMVDVKGSRFFQKVDAVTILEQIEGAMAYLDTVGTRADTRAYKRMRLVLTSAHRSLHNRMHQRGIYHGHNAAERH